MNINSKEILAIEDKILELLATLGPSAETGRLAMLRIISCSIVAEASRGESVNVKQIDSELTRLGAELIFQTKRIETMLSDPTQLTIYKQDLAELSIKL